MSLRSLTSAGRLGLARQGRFSLKHPSFSVGCSLTAVRHGGQECHLGVRAISASNRRWTQADELGQSC